MIISHRKKFAFFANQKTGSKAVGLVLRLSGIFDENDIMIAQPFPATRTARINLPEYNLNEHKTHLVNHFRPKDAIEAGFITLEQLREYDCYAFLREPEQRFLASRASMMMNRQGKIAMPGYRAGGVAPPQHTFFFVGDEQVVTPLDFGNYEQEIRMLLEKLGANKQMDVPEINKIFGAHMVHEIKYDPIQHMEDILLYRQMKDEILNRETS